MSKISVVVPVYNESTHIEEYLEEMISGLKKLDQSFEVIISENGSTDDTKKIAKKLTQKYKELKLISSRDANYGQAVKKGFEKATGNYLVLFDLDYHDITFLKKSLKLLNKHDIVVGSKNLKNSRDQRSLLRKLGSQCFTFILRSLFGYQLHDTHGIKVLRHKKVKELIKSTIFTREIFDTELLLRAQNAGLKLAELPVKVKEKRKSRSSILTRTIKTLPDIMKLKVILLSESLHS